MPIWYDIGPMLDRDSWNQINDVIYLGFGRKRLIFSDTKEGAFLLEERRGEFGFTFFFGCMFNRFFYYLHPSIFATWIITLIMVLWYEDRE